MCGGFSTYITYSGSDPETTQFFEKIIGQSRVTRVSASGRTMTITSCRRRASKKDKYQEYNLLNANEIRTIPDNTALMVSGARNPVLLNVVPHYQNRAIAKALRAGAAPLPQQPVHNGVVPRVPMGG